MLKPKSTLLCKLHNTTTNEVCGIPAGGSRVIFCTPTWLAANWSSFPTAVNAGELVASDIAGNELTPALAVGAALELMSEGQSFQTMKGFPTFPSYAATVSLHWNLSAVHVLMDAIGADMLTTDLEALGVTKAGTIAKLSDAYELVELGQFAEAAVAVRAITPDAFLTSARLELYASMLESANAIS